MTAYEPALSGVPTPPPELLREACRLAQRLPLVRVVVPRPATHPRHNVEIEDVLDRGLARVEHRGGESRRTETELRATPGVYFHAGRTHPDYGDMALALAPFDCKAEATPFGLGGLACKADCPAIQCIRPVGHAANALQCAFVAASVWADDWRRHVALYLATYFSDFDRYFQNDPPALYPAVARSTDWRAWTVEVRVLGEDVDLAQALSRNQVLIWAMTDDLYKECTAKPDNSRAWFDALLEATANGQAQRVEMRNADAIQLFRKVDEWVRAWCQKT